jgi:hypothetical protein
VGHLLGDGVLNGHLRIYFHLSIIASTVNPASLVTFCFTSGAGGFPAGGEDFQSHVAAGFDPFVVLLGQHRADQADDSVPAGEDANHVGAAPDHLVQPLLRVLLQIRRHTSQGNAVNARMSSRASSRWAAAAGQLGLQHGDDLGVLGADRGRAARPRPDTAAATRDPGLGSLSLHPPTRPLRPYLIMARFSVSHLIADPARLASAAPTLPAAERAALRRLDRRRRRARRMTASVGCSIFGSSRCSTRTSHGAWRTAPRMVLSL